MNDEQPPVLGRKRPPEFQQWLAVKQAYASLEEVVRKNKDGLRSPEVLDACEELFETLEELTNVLDPKPVKKT